MHKERFEYIYWQTFKFKITNCWSVFKQKFIQFLAQNSFVSESLQRPAGEAWSALPDHLPKLGAGYPGKGIKRVRGKWDAPISVFTQHIGKSVPLSLSNNMLEAHEGSNKKTQQFKQCRREGSNNSRQEYVIMHLTELMQRTICRCSDGWGDVNVSVAWEGKFTAVRPLSTAAAETGSSRPAWRRSAQLARDVSNAHLITAVPRRRPILPIHTIHQGYTECDR